MRDLSKPLAPTFGAPKKKRVRKTTDSSKGTSTRAGRNRSVTFSSPGGGAPAKRTVTTTRIRRNKQGNVVSQKVKSKGISNKRFRTAADRIAIGEARQAFQEKKGKIKK